MGKEKIPIVEVCKAINMSKQHFVRLMESGIVKGFKDENGRYYVERLEYERLCREFYADEVTYTPAQLSRILKISQPTILKYCLEGKIETYPLPTGRYVIPEKELLRLKEAKAYSKTYCKIIDKL